MKPHRLPLSEAQEGFRLMSKAGQSLKVILEPNRVKFVRDKKQHRHTHYYVTRIRRD
jgi:hypothetical protein